MGCKSLQFETKADFDRWQQDYDRHIIDGDTVRHALCFDEF